MKKYISKFHYLTQDLPQRSHVEQTAIACKAGANWIQYRCLTKTDPELIDELHQVASICDDWGATLILTDHYHLLDQVDAQGVHLEDMQADFNKIRKLSVMRRPSEHLLIPLRIFNAFLHQVWWIILDADHSR
jgi:thiamine-phosphate pyrophosphorylase